MRKMLFQKQCPPLLSLFFCATLVLSGCKMKGYTSPQNYQIGNPQKTLLGKSLNEISGICYTPDGNLLGVSDSKEKIIQINLKTKKLKDLTDKIVEKNSDLEDIVQVDSSIYLLMSKGIIKEFRQNGDSSSVQTYTLSLDGANDFETLYYDPSVKGLVLLCKTCAHEKGAGVRTAYRFDLETKKFDSTVFFTINKEQVKGLVKNGDAKFDPSAAAIHPINKRLYILSSAGDLLVITDTRGKVIEAYQLNPDDFPQPEGIAFAPNGNMYISNEGKYGQPNLLLFPYIQHGKKK